MKNERNSKYIKKIENLRKRSALSGLYIFVYNFYVKCTVTKITANERSDTQEIY